MREALQAAGFRLLMGQAREKGLMVFSHQSAGAVADECADIKSVILLSSPEDVMLLDANVLFVCLVFVLFCFLGFESSTSQKLGKLLYHWCIFQADHQLKILQELGM